MEELMATYKQIQNYVQEHYSIKIQTCWIAHIKEKLGLPIRKAPNRIDNNKRVKPCPSNYERFIEQAFKHFKMI